eukprot:SM000005S17122  [mRNA]  locus=s5:217542:218218:- [translate_table: standard]
MAARRRRCGAGPQEAAWLAGAVAAELGGAGLDAAAARAIGDACSEGCRKLLQRGGIGGRGRFDAMTLLDAMEEEVERASLRSSGGEGGDTFLPAELGRRAAVLLQHRWARPEAAPAGYTPSVSDNRLDIIDVDALPPLPLAPVPPAPPLPPASAGSSDLVDADQLY